LAGAEFVFRVVAASGTPASEPSPHLISIVGCDVARLVDDLVGASKKRIDAVLMLAIDSINAMIKRGFIVSFLGPKRFRF
jgi:hypothetical protein